MRLVCPNCDAEYEVDASVIPEAGRDVQCSNCGHAWFQMSPEHEAAAAEEEELFDAPPAPAAAQVRDIAPTPEVSLSTVQTVQQAPAEPEVAVAPRGLDESVLAVLREEAEREASARHAEGSPGIETQTEMGLQPTAESAEETVAKRVSRLKGVEPDVLPPVPARAPTRRELLPEIDEINSSLRAASEKRSGDAAAIAYSLDETKRNGSGFRSGFVLMLLLAVLGTALYVMAPKIVEQIPGAAPAMTRYVETVDIGRIWLDDTLKVAIAWMVGLSGGKG